jgi:hypothetical protein
MSAPLLPRFECPDATFERSDDSQNFECRTNVTYGHTFGSRHCFASKLFVIFYCTPADVEEAFGVKFFELTLLYQERYLTYN